MKIDVEIERCICGSSAKLETVHSMKFCLLHKGPMVAWRVVCPVCGEGRRDIFGHKTRKAAVESWNDCIRFQKEAEKAPPLSDEQRRDLILWAHDNPKAMQDAFGRVGRCIDLDMESYAKLISSGSFDDYYAMEAEARDIYIGIAIKAKEKIEGRLIFPLFRW